MQSAPCDRVHSNGLGQRLALLEGIPLPAWRKGRLAGPIKSRQQGVSSVVAMTATSATACSLTQSGVMGEGVRKDRSLQVGRSPYSQSESGSSFR